MLKVPATVVDVVGWRWAHRHQRHQPPFVPPLRPPHHQPRHRHHRCRTRQPPQIVRIHRRKPPHCTAGRRVHRNTKHRPSQRRRQRSPSHHAKPPPQPHAFLAYAAVRPAIAVGMRESSGQLRAFIAGQIRAAQATTETALRIDPAKAATGLMALVDGLGVHVLGQHYSPEEAVAALDEHLDALFGATPRTPQ
jgi:hypothetical protein